jgi:hypothetical protein
VSARDDIVKRLSTALETVNAAEIPDDLRAVAFWRAYVELAEEAATPSPDHPPGPSGDKVVNDTLLGQISRSLSLDYDVVTAIFEQTDDGIQLIVPKGSLPNASSKAASMRDIALLLAAGRQAAGLEDYTALSIIRDECSELGVLDASNFSVEISRLGMRARGGRNSREVRASRHQLEQAADLMGRIGGT